MQKIDFIEQFVSMKKKLDSMMDEAITMETIRAFDGTAMEFDLFYTICTTRFVESILKVGEGFLDPAEFFYRIEVELIDKSTITLSVLADSFKLNFLSEHKIVVDTMECMHTLNKMIRDNRFVTELNIHPPQRYKLRENEAQKRSLNFSGIEEGGVKCVEYGSISEVDEKLIQNIP